MLQSRAPPGIPLILASASYLKSLLPPSFTPEVGIIGGSGLSALEDVISSFSSKKDARAGLNGEDENPRVEISFKDIAGFPVSTAPGHAGKLLFGTLTTTNKKKLDAVVMSGRAHLYEGYDLKTATFPIRVMGAMGVKTLIVTNAAGGLNSSYNVGDIMILNDHISLPSLSGTGNPLSGPLDTPLSAGPGLGGPRFLALSDAYDLRLRRATWQVWKEMRDKVRDVKEKGVLEDRSLHEGVYAFVGGPTYETRAEARFLSLLGADVVGMSTVPEITVARHIGIRVLGLCLVTNKVTKEKISIADDIDNQTKNNEKLLEDKVCHEEVLEAGKNAAELMKQLIVNVVGFELSSVSESL